MTSLDGFCPCTTGTAARVPPIAPATLRASRREKVLVGVPGRTGALIAGELLTGGEASKDELQGYPADGGGETGARVTLPRPHPSHGRG